MNQSVPAKTKKRDVAIGFFGWAISSNLIFFLLLFSELEKPFETTGLVIWIIAIASATVLFVKKKVWVCAGVVIDVVVNAGVWIFLYFPPRFNEIGEMIRNSILPFPGAILLMFQ